MMLTAPFPLQSPVVIAGGGIKSLVAQLDVSASPHSPLLNSGDSILHSRV